MPSNKDDKYTGPELRSEAKKEIQAGDKDGASGQRSARKAQIMASEYKRRGGGYTTDKKDKDETQKHLDRWTEEEWQTKEGSRQAKLEDGIEQRYLPKKTWEQMSEQEKEETDAKKQEEGKQVEQYVSNTLKVKEARKNASYDSEANGSGKYKASNQKSDMKDARSCHEHWEEPGHLKRNLQAYKGFQEINRSSANASKADKSGSRSNGDQEESGLKKRGRGANASSPNKKQKSNASKHDESNGTAGGKNHVPKKGQKV